MTLDVIVADDEPLGRRGILARLRGRDVRVVAECSNGREAVDAIRQHSPHLLFLDVQMPGLDGFETLQRLTPEERPHVIFVTAFDRFALQAFEVHALDYLLKPIDDRRFAEAFERAVANVGAGFGPVKPVPTFAVRQRGRTVFLRHHEIDWVEAQGDYVRLHSGSRQWLVRETMACVERQLGSGRFLRIHRSTIVNVDRVQEVRPFDTGDCAVFLRDGTQLRLSRNYRSRAGSVLS